MSDNIETLTLSEAQSLAQSTASRDLRETETAISFVGYSNALADYCFFELRRQAPDAWTVTLRSLTSEERLPDEEISDTKITQLARSGNLLGAIRLFRTKHEVGLTQAKAGVEHLLATS